MQSCGNEKHGLLPVLDPPDRVRVGLRFMVDAGWLRRSEVGPSARDFHQLWPAERTILSGYCLHAARVTDEVDSFRMNDH
jgi:hypothetical protein